MNVLFETGRMFQTRGIGEESERNEAFAQFVHDSLLKHVFGDWGDVCEEDRLTNENALRCGDRLFSVYMIPKSINVETSDDDSIWIITEWDRSVTTVLFPEEY